MRDEGGKSKRKTVFGGEDVDETDVSDEGTEDPGLQKAAVASSSASNKSTSVGGGKGKSNGKSVESAKKISHAPRKKKKKKCVPAAKETDDAKEAAPKRERGRPLRSRTTRPCWLLWLHLYLLSALRLHLSRPL